MTLMELFQGLPARVPEATAVEVAGLAYDSRRVEAGDLFVAMVGQRVDGRVFASQAASRGAVAVLGRGSAPADFTGIWIEAEEPRTLLAPLAARLHEHPDQELTTVGVTGTNGKSTVVALVAAMLEEAGRPCGRIGTLGYRFGETTFPGDRTTPEAPDLFAMLAEMRDLGARAVAMEVSSHALELGRVAALELDVAVFTNLSRDHFDFHEGFESYFEAKRRIFSLLAPGGRSVLNVDDPYGRRLAEELPDALTFGAEGQVSAVEASLTTAGIRAEIATPRGSLAVETALLGRFNLENVLAAVAAAVALDLDADTIVGALRRVGPLPGRLEPVDRDQAFLAVVDYAHTDAALAAALASARELTAEGRVLVVFGCGGDRDPGKRALMGRVAGLGADYAVATSDNPRGEDPMRILSAVEQGLLEAGAEARWEIEPDRRAAIERVVELARPGDVVVVAGKGHEEEQIIGEGALPFSDRETLATALEALGGGSDRG